MRGEIDQAMFDRVKKKAEEHYHAFGSVPCPVLNRKVVFNRKGLGHIIFKDWNKTRPLSDQFLRLKFLRYALVILVASGTVQEYKETKGRERVRSTGKWQYALLPVRY